MKALMPFDFPLFFCKLACLRFVGITNAYWLKRSDSENRASKGELA